MGLFGFGKGKKKPDILNNRDDQKAEEKAKTDYKNAIDKLNNNPSEAEANDSRRTIFQIASANECYVPEAQQWMGDFCETIQKDNKEAANWYKKAADNGSADGARCYADMLISGRGVEKNEEEAIKYYHIAADKGQVESMFVLGQYYLKKGYSAMAHSYFKAAADYGFSPAREILNKLDNGEDNKERPPYQIAFDNAFARIVIKNDMSHNGFAEYFADIYQPNDFCKNVFDYCTKHYDGESHEKMAFEYLMTAFYGCICSVALWNNNSSDFYATTAWNVVKSSIDPEFTDKHAEELLGTKNGEDKAEGIYALINDYMRLTRSVMVIFKCHHDVCICAMKLAYKLGMLVAKKEISIQNNHLIFECFPPDMDNLEDPNKDDSEDPNKDDSEDPKSLKSPFSFYEQCVSEFHDVAMELGVANRGVIFIPELLEYGEETILDLLKDPFINAQFSQDPVGLYATIMALSIDEGIVFGAKWHEDFSNLRGYVDRIMIEGPAKDAEKLMKKHLPKEYFSNHGNPFFSKIYPHWLSLHKPYWKLKDPREYTFKLMIAAYQLGISVILEKFGF